MQRSGKSKIQRARFGAPESWASHTVSLATLKRVARAPSHPERRTHRGTRSIAMDCAADRIEKWMGDFSGSGCSPVVTLMAQENIKTHMPTRRTLSMKQRMKKQTPSCSAQAVPGMSFLASPGTVVQPEPRSAPDRDRRDPSHGAT
eukprot:1196987-Rhodomonas_salina.3